jgi:hypothetical protein
MRPVLLTAHPANGCQQRTRDPYAIGYGTYRLVDAKGRVKVHRGDYGLSLDEVMRYLRTRSVRAIPDTPT